MFQSCQTCTELIDCCAKCKLHRVLLFYWAHNLFKNCCWATETEGNQWEQSFKSNMSGPEGSTAPSKCWNKLLSNPQDLWHDQHHSLPFVTWWVRSIVCCTQLQYRKASLFLQDMSLIPVCCILRCFISNVFTSLSVIGYKFRGKSSHTL